MARLRARIPVKDDNGTIQPGVTVKFYQPGTGAVVGSVTTGTPFEGALYAANEGGSALGTSFVSDATGHVVVFTETHTRVDVGLEIPGAAAIFPLEAWEIDPGDLVFAADLDPDDALKQSREQNLIQAGSTAAPGLGFEDDPGSGLGLAGAGLPFISNGSVRLLETLASSMAMRSPNGTYAATMADTGVFSAPGLLRSLGVWNVADHGLVAGSSSSLAAANKTALQTLFAAVCADGGGKIVFPPGIWSLPNNVNLDHALGYSMSVHIEGMGGRATQLRLHGTSGPFLNWGSSTTGGYSFPSMKHLYIQHNDLVSTGGATIKLGSTTPGMLLEGVEISPGQVDGDGIGTNGALIGIDLCTTLYVHYCQIRTRIDALAPANTTSILVREAEGAGGLFIGDHSGLTGAPGRSAGIRFTNANLWDTMILSGGSGMSGHDAGIVKQDGAGGVMNVTVGDFHFDACNYDVVLQPPTGSIVGTWQMSNVWAAAGAGSYVLMDEAAGGTVREIDVDNWRCTDAEADGIVIGAGVTDVRVTNCRVPTVGGSGTVGIKVGAAANVTVANNQVTMHDAAATASIEVSASATPVVVIGNLSRGKDISFGGATSAARINDKNAYAA